MHPARKCDPRYAKTPLRKRKTEKDRQPDQNRHGSGRVLQAVQRCASSRALRPKLFETAGHTSHTPQEARDENASCSEGGGSAGLGAGAPALRICHQHPVAHTVPWEVWGGGGSQQPGPVGCRADAQGRGKEAAAMGLSTPRQCRAHRVGPRPSPRKPAGRSVSFKLPIRSNGLTRVPSSSPWRTRRHAPGLPRVRVQTPSVT